MGSSRAAAAAVSLFVAVGVGCAPPDSGVRAVRDDPNRTTTTVVPSGPTPEYLARVSAASSEQEPGRYMVAVVSRATGTPGQPSATLNGFFDVATGRRRMLADVRQLFEIVGSVRPPSASTVPGRPLVQPSAEESGAVLALLSEPLDVVYDGDTAVLTSPAVTSELDDPSKPWVRVTGGLELPTDRLGIGPSRDTARSLIESLRGAATGVTEVGIEPFYGEQATHYQAFLDLSEAASALPSEAQDRFWHGFAGVGVESALVEIWVDRQDRLRRIEVPLGSARTRATLVAEFREYGSPQSIELPPADQVQDAPAEIAGLLRPR